MSQGPLPPSPPPGLPADLDYQSAPKTSGMALASMIMGILAIPLGCLLVGVPLGVVALVLGIIALNRVNRDPIHFSGKGMAITGIVTGGLGGVLVIPLLIAILLPSLGKARELANRSVCAANVRGIAQSMHIYGVDNGDSYPLVAAPAANSPPRYKLAANAQAPGGASEGATYESIYTTNPQINAGSPQACLWLLCIRGDVSPKQFLCKSDPVGSAPAPLLSTTAMYYSNFTDPATPAQSDLRYSYSIAYPWTADPAKPVGGWWQATSDASNPLLADLSPQNGTARSTPGMPYNAVTKMANSVHHQRDGQNIAFGDAHAEFQRTPFVGQNGDNIYTAGNSGPAFPSSSSNPISASETIPTGWTGGTPGNYDTIMVPTANADTNARF